MIIREYKKDDLPQMISLWNEIVDEGNAFPQEQRLTERVGEEFFSSQTYTAVADENGEIRGLYILHPNNVGRCGHICNASYAVDSRFRGRHIGERLVLDCIVQGRIHCFKILQFNAVVESNIRARRLYERLGFIQLGVIPNGFRMKDGSFAAICPYYIEL